MYRLRLIIQDRSGFRIEVLQRLCQRLQCLDSVRLLRLLRLLSIPYFSFTQGHQKVLYLYHKQCCLQPQPPQELTLGGSFEVPA